MQQSYDHAIHHSKLKIILQHYIVKSSEIIMSCTNLQQTILTSLHECGKKGDDMYKKVLDYKDYAANMVVEIARKWKHINIPFFGDS